MVAHVPMKASGTKVLKGPERVATLLFAMGKPAASKILRHFSEEEIRLVTKSAAQLGPVSPSQIEQLVEEFASNFSDGADLIGGAAHIEKLLTGILSPEQISNIMSEVVGNANRSIWERISTVSESAIASYLMKEHPQTAALILSRVKPSCAAKIMTQLPQPLRNNLMRRMLSMKPIVDGYFVVTLEETKNAMRLLAEKARVIAEGAGALPVAAALTGKAGNGPIVAIISGGNIDLQKFWELIAESAY